MFLNRFHSVQDKSSLRVTLTLTAIFFAFMLVFSLHRFYTLYASYDQALFDQLFWNTIHGHWFQGSLSSGQSSAVLQDGQVHTVFYCHLGQHFVIDFLLWLPIYALFPTGATLVVLQVTLITAAGLVLYFLARHYLRSSIAIFIIASYYGGNAVIGPTIANFYEHSQIPLFVFSLLLALVKRKWWFFWLFVILILGIREDTGIILFGIGLYLLLSRSYPRLGVALCLISFGYIALLTNAIMPLFSHDNSRLYLGSFFAKFASGNPSPSTLQIFWGMITHPGALLESLFFPLDKRVKYFLGQWLPLAFIPVRSPAAWIVAAPPLLVLLIQDRQIALGMSVRFALTVVPGLFYGTILWWHQHQSKFKQLHRWWIRCIALSMAIAITSSPNQAFYFLIPDSINPWVHIPLTRQWEHVGYTRQLMNLIPPEKSVSATNFVLPLLATRRGIIRFPALQLRNDLKEVVDVDYILADLWRLQQYQSAFKVERQQLRDYVIDFDRLLAQGRYGLVDVQDGVVLLKKQIASSAQSLERWLKFTEEIYF